MSSYWKNGFFSLAAVLSLLVWGKPLFAAQNALSPPVDAKALQKARTQYLIELDKEHYFRVATCDWFASFLLTQSGLPALGKDSQPATGTRGDVDRKGENERPPIFVDSLSLDRPPSSVRIEGKAGATPGSWTLSLSRMNTIAYVDPKTGKKSGRSEFHADSTFVFQISSALNQSSCDLQKIDVSLKADKQNFALNRSLNAEDCIDLLANKKLAAMNAPRGLREIVLFSMRNDCRISLHYSQKAKEMVKEAIQKNQYR